MVLYICNKCNKNFSRKQSYQAHINRKYSCILTENFNTNLELEENNKQYEENNKELTDRIKNLEKDKDILKEENFTMKVQIKEKQDLLNNKDIEIKDLYKNILK
jgi:hypothetical protein